MRESKESENNYFTESVYHTADNYFAERCSGSEAGSYLRLIDFLYHSRLVCKAHILCVSLGSGEPVLDVRVVCQLRGTPVYKV